MDLAKIETVNSAELAKSGSAVGTQIMNRDSVEFFTSLRVKNPQSQELPGNAGEWILGKEVVLGPGPIDVLVGPYRPAARRWENNTCGLQAYNRTKTSKVIKDENGNYHWQMTQNSKAFQEIFDRVKPDAGMKCRNSVGFDFLVYVIGHGWAVYFVADSAKNQGNCIPLWNNNQGKVFALESRRGAGQYHYYVPETRLKTDQNQSWPSDADIQFRKFLDVPIEVAVDEQAAQVMER